MHRRSLSRRPNGQFCIAAVLTAALPGAAFSGHAAGCPEHPASPIDIAIFDFELEDLTPAAALLDRSTSASTSLDRATRAARREFSQSARYRVIDGAQAHAKAVQEATLRNCEGCEARIAAQLGAEQSLLGVIRRVTQTDYYVQIQIREVCSGKILGEESANFAGGEEGWASGARMLIRHQVLASSEATIERRSGQAAPTTAHGLCKTAIVNPVSGFAECVDPRGTAVASPPADMSP